MTSRKQAALYRRFPSLRLYDQLGVSWMLTGDSGRFGETSGPIWAGAFMILYTNSSYGDEGFFHELCHWIAASPAQRKLPDLALGRQINSSTDTFATSPSLGGVVWLEGEVEGFEGDADHNSGWGEKTVSRSVAARQEALACHAMWFYRPLVRLEKWTAAHPSSYLAAVDFAGSVCPTEKEIRDTWSKVLTVIDPDLSYEQVSAFYRRQGGLDD